MNLGRSFSTIMELVYLLKGWITRPKGQVIREPITKVVQIGGTVTHSLEAIIFRVDTISISLISFRVKLIGYLR